MSAQLIAHYTLDEDQTGAHSAEHTDTIQDSVGSNHAIAFDVTFGDDPAEGGGFFIGAAGNDGNSTRYVKIDTPSNFYLQTFSFAFWVKPISFNYRTGRNRTWLLSCMGTKGGWHLSFAKNRHVTLQQFEDISGGGAFRQVTTDNNSEKVVGQEWKHYVATVSPSGLTLYVNGEVAKTVTTPIEWDMDFTNAEFYFARVYDNSNAGGLGEMFSGILDDVRFYSGVLNDSEVFSLYSAGRPYTPPGSSSSTPTGKIFTSVLGRPNSIVKPNPHLGWVASTSAGQSFESTDGAAGTWSSPATIPGGGHNRNVSPIVSEGGFWFAIVGGDSSFFQQQNHLAYANALDGSSSSVFPSTNGWVQITDDGSSVDKPRALYGDGVYAYNTQVNDDSMTGSWQNTLYRSNIAADSTSTPVWTQLNANASWNGQSVTGSMTDTDGNSVSSALSIYHGAANGTLHVWVCKDQNDPTEFKACKIVTYDMAAGTDVIQATFANKPNAAVCLRVPVYCSASSAWFVPCRDGVLKSTDGGLNWSLISISYGSADYVYVNALAASESGTLVAVGYTTTSGTEAGIIYRSADAGATWTAIATHEENLYSVAAATDGNWVVGGTNNTLGLSTDDGMAWAYSSDAEDNGSAGATVSALHYGGLE